MPSQTLPFNGYPTVCQCEDRSYEITCAVSFALVQSGGVHYRKVLLISSLHELRATVDQHGTRRHGVDLSHEDRGIHRTTAAASERDENNRSA